MLCTALSKIDKQAQILEDWIGELRSELDTDMKACDCFTADEELAGILAAMKEIQGKTGEKESRKRGIAKRLDGVRSCLSKEWNNLRNMRVQREK